MRHAKLIFVLVLFAATAVVVTAGVFVFKGPAPSTAQEPSAPAQSPVPAPVVSASPGPPPPAWLLEEMSNEARACGDAHADAWWVHTTAGKAGVLEGHDTSDIADPDRPVDVYLLCGDFTNWIWTLPAGTSAPEYRWVFAIIDAESHVGDVVGNSEKPFDTTGLELQRVVLPGRRTAAEPTP